ncbi:uncharacterized protein YebE (UPF0316 family) [Mobilisporobacter senegalensis]|uniref:Uncharacterized protein YebE (UPF0316 family) n=1 Tax=Mobilisporobacter senegalensis TaxID=1329262 RepID=A0A3N1X6B5_9FIRM|nr:DUF5698 domain-containing protein [Mobilisporobacter senegalensis]ROR22329.1 uncharacterized protein YebE (UPF0316 family) [Mobilisporobacter senegalensis]
MDFLEGSVFIYLFIFLGKILEVTVATVRVVLINRGEREKGAVIAFFEILLWLFITGTVLAGFQEDIIRVIVFAIAFAVGNYLGSWLEEKLAFGLSSIQVIVPEGEVSDELVKTLRSNDYAVTILKGSGKDGVRDLMVLHLMRKRIPTAVSLIKSSLNNAVIIVNDVKVAHGGYIKK